MELPEAGRPGLRTGSIVQPDQPRRYYMHKGILIAASFAGGRPPGVNKDSAHHGGGRSGIRSQSRHSGGRAGRPARHRWRLGCRESVV
jgi:hypothetical protein